MSGSTIDLRSDTVTRPTTAMRRAMAEADVGDDVYGEDPTINRLQECVAELLGVDAALFVPSGTMANQIAVKVHTQPGDEILAGQGAHTWLFEAGGAAAISGVQATLLPGDGRFDADAVRAAYKPESDHHAASSTLVAVENTHNMGGGLVWDMERLRAVTAVARELGMGTHLDGARLWNAAVATGRPERELAAGFDTISVCLSKGLGAPVGSLVCGTKALIHRAHKVRKMLGGGMRQAGILAAAGLFALEHHRARLAEDHANAAFLADEVGRLPGVQVARDSVRTNIVMVDIAPEARAELDASTVARRARARGLLFGAMSATRLRLVTHLDVDRAACARAVEILAGVLASPGAAA